MKFGGCSVRALYATALLFSLGVIVFSAQYVSAKSQKKPVPKKEVYESYAEIPHFIDSQLLRNFPTQEEFMQKLMQDMRENLTSDRKSVSYMDDEGNITRKSLERFEKLVRRDLVKTQKQTFFKYDFDRDKKVTLDELAGDFGYRTEDAEALYDAVEQHGDKAKDILDPLLDKAQENSSQKYQAISFLKEYLLVFKDLDVDGDKNLSFEEIQEPSITRYKKRTDSIVSKFEAYLSLSEDGDLTTLDQINDAAIKSFNTIDMSKDGVVDQNEFSVFLREAYRYRDNKCIMYSLLDEEALTYVGIIGVTNAVSSVKFHGRFSELAGYVSVHIEKQNQPLNLVLFSQSKLIWSIEGEVDSISRVIILGPSSTEKVYAGVKGVPEEKIKFIKGECFGSQTVPGEHVSATVTNWFFKYAIRRMETLLGAQPHLVKFQPNASSLKIKTQPQILFFKDISEGLKELPERYDAKYWAKFLEWKSAGYKKLDIESLVLGAYATNIKMPPYWAGLSQLELDGVIEPLNIDDEGRKAVFLLKKNLPAFPEFGTSKRHEITFIMDDPGLSFPDNEESIGLSYYCVMSKKGEFLFGHNGCSASNLAFLPSDMDNMVALEDDVYLSVPSYLPILPSNTDSIDIPLSIDNDMCIKKYGSYAAKKCQIPEAVIRQEILPHALNIEPRMSGKVSWKDQNTITFEPANVWRSGGLYTVTLNLDHMNLPEGIYLNQKRVSKTKFYAAPISVEAKNVDIKDDPNNLNHQILTVDITPNYPLGELDIVPVYVPETAIQPDEHLAGGSLEYQNFVLEYAGGVRHLNFDPAGQKITAYVQKRNDGLKPNYLALLKPMAVHAGDVITARPVWVSLSPETTVGLPDEIAELIKKANKGDVKAQVQLGNAYFEGVGIHKSLSKARAWYMRAAQQGDTEAYYRLGVLNNDVYIRAHDNRLEAFSWFYKAAENGHQEAQYQLGVIQQRNNSYYHDYDESRKRYMQAAAQGHVRALISLGLMHQYGMGIDVNYQEAMMYYEKAAEHNSAQAFIRMAFMYHLGKGVKEDPKKAYELAKKSASLVERYDFVTRNLLGVIVAEILYDRFKANKEFDIRGAITEKVFEDFSKGYVRMWISDGFVDIWDGGNQTHLIARRLILEQQKDTPKMPELRIALAEATLSDGYLHNDRGVSLYHPANLAAAIDIYESLIPFQPLEQRIINRLAVLYISKRDIKAAEKLFLYAEQERYFTVQKIAWARARYARNMGNLRGAWLLYQEIGDDYGAASVYLSFSGHTEQLDKVLKADAEKNQDRAWSQGNYAQFLLYTKNDYEGAIVYGEKALKIMNYPMARGITGMAYLIKASELYQKPGKSKESHALYLKAQDMGIDRWYIKDNCGKYCGQISRMMETYKDFKEEQPL